MGKPINYKKPEELDNPNNGAAAKASNAMLNTCIDCMAGLEIKEPPKCTTRPCTARSIGRKYYARLRAEKVEDKAL